MKRTLALSIVISVLCLISVPWSLSANPETLDIGDSAPEFELPGVDGKTYSLEDFSDAEILAIVFTCNHCPTAQEYEDRIIEMTKDYKDDGVAVIAVSPNDPLAVRLDELGYTDVGDSFEDMKIRAEDKEFNFPYLYDGDDQKMSMAYGPVATPHVFVFDKERKLRYEGRIDDSAKEKNVKSPDMKNAIEALLAGKDVPVKSTKPFGCSIKWADKRGSVKDAFERWAKEDVAVEYIGVDGVKKLVANDSDNLRLINVWATWCGPCVAEFPDLIEINRMYRHRNFEMITISSDSPDKKDDVLKFLKKQEASTKNYLFEKEDVYQLIEAVDKEWPGAIPYTILVNSDGEIVYRHMGAIDPLEVKQEIVERIGRYYK